MTTVISPSGVTITDVKNVSLNDYLAAQNAQLANLQNSLTVTQDQINSINAAITSVQAIIADINNAINSGTTSTIS